LSQNSFSLDLDEVKKKSEELMEQDNLEQYSKNIDLIKEKIDITNMSFAEYLDFPEELQIKREKWMFDFLGDDEFYQFLLKDSFKNTSFTLGDLETKFHNFFYHGGDMDFDNERWKEIIFKFLEVNPPLIEQFFEKETATIKLRLTDEAYKA
jgi:type I restriction enzyme S subunit